MPDEDPKDPSSPRKFGRRPRREAAPGAEDSTLDAPKPRKVRIGPRKEVPPAPPPPPPPPPEAARVSRGGVKKPGPLASKPTQGSKDRKSFPGKGSGRQGQEGRKHSRSPREMDKGRHPAREKLPREASAGALPSDVGPRPAAHSAEDWFESRDAVSPQLSLGLSEPESAPRPDSGADSSHGSDSHPGVGLSRNARRRKRRKDRKHAPRPQEPSDPAAFEPFEPFESDRDATDVSFEPDDSDLNLVTPPPPSGLSTVFPETSFLDTSFPDTNFPETGFPEEGGDDPETSLPGDGQGGAREGRSKRRRKKRRERQEFAPVDRASGYWWAEQWIRSFETLYSGGASRARLQKGRSYARRGQVTELEVGPNGVLARVQGSRPKPYQVRLELNRLRRETWGRILHQLAGKAAFLAQLLEGSLPPEIEDVFFASGARLFPHGDNDVRSRCTCPDPVVPCKHVASVHYVMADALQRDPFLLFALRGKGRDQFLQDLRDMRGRDGARRESFQPIAEDLGRFWRMGRLAESVLRPTGWGTGGDPARLIQSLGEPQLEGIREGLFLPLLESTYRQVSEGMRRLPKDD